MRQSFLFRICGVWGERGGKHKRGGIENRTFWKGPHNAGLVLWFGLSSPSWVEEWKRLSAGMSGVPSNGAGRVTGQWERGLQSGGLIFSWWTQPPAPQCSLIARAEPAYGLCLEVWNDRINSACRKKGAWMLDMVDYDSLELDVAESWCSGTHQLNNNCPALSFSVPAEMNSSVHCF